MTSGTFTFRNSSILSALLCTLSLTKTLAFFSEVPNKWMIKKLRNGRFTYSKIRGWTEKFIVISTVDDFFSMGPKHCNTDGISEWTARETMLKNKPPLVIFYKRSLVS